MCVGWLVGWLVDEQQGHEASSFHSDVTTSEASLRYTTVNVRTFVQHAYFVQQVKPNKIEQVNKVK